MFSSAKGKDNQETLQAENPRTRFIKRFQNDNMFCHEIKMPHVKAGNNSQKLLKNKVSPGRAMFFKKKNPERKALDTEFPDATMQITFPFSLLRISCLLKSVNNTNEQFLLHGK